MKSLSAQLISRNFGKACENIEEKKNKYHFLTWTDIQIKIGMDIKIEMRSCD